jgi:glycosyltransferase involved in cell wall biosynthesis
MYDLTIISPLHISFCGGFERWVYEVATRLVKLGYKVTIITSRYGAKGCTFRLPTKINYVAVESIYVYPKNIFEFFGHVGTPDIVYVNMSFVGYDLISFFIKSLKNIKIVYGYHGPLFRQNIIRYSYWTMSASTMLRVADLHHVLNEERRKFLFRRGIRNIIKIPNGVDTSKFKLRLKNKISDMFKILYVGALTYVKGVDRLVKLILKVNKARIFNKVEFIIVGDGPLTPYIMKLANKFNNIKYLGRISNDTILAQIYSSANVFVNLSRHEEFSIAPLEALSAGTPVVAFNTPGIREYAKEPSVKLVDNLNDMFNAIYAIYRLWNDDPERYVQVCKLARTLAEKYDWNVIVLKFHKVFQKLLN